jgi:hypothetical protein
VHIAFRSLFPLLALIAFAQAGAVESPEFVTQILEPTGGKIVRPADWFYAEGHGPSSYMWTISKEDSRNGQPYVTGVRIQVFAGVKAGTGKTAREFILDFVTEKRKAVTKVISDCGESRQELFNRICLETEEGPYRIQYSLFWGENTDFAVILIAGTRTELWEQYAPTFARMSAFELTDATRFDNRAAAAATNPADAVAVYLVPLDDFPEDVAGSLARALQQSMGLRIKASLRLPPLALTAMPGTNQYSAEDIMSLAANASAGLPDMSPNTQRVFLTQRDINSRSGNFRYQYSMHNRALNTSVVSLARLLDYSDGRPFFTERSAVRLQKMTKRAVGELHLGWTRSADRADVMYSPIMGPGDLDSIGLEHKTGDAGAPAVKVYHMAGVILMQPDFVLNQRIPNAQGLADYVVKVNEAIEAATKTYAPPTSAGGFIVLAVRPGGKSKAWLDVQPPLPAALASRVMSAIQTVPPFPAKSGTVVFAINASFWGGAIPRKQPYPDEWAAIAKKHSQPLEASQVADLAWGKR